MSNLAQVNTVAAVAVIQASIAAQQAGIATAAAASILSTPSAWTPTDASGGANAFINVIGQSCLIGNMVVAEFVLTYPGSVSSGSSTAKITLPTPVPNQTFAKAAAPCIVSGMGTATGVLLVAVPNSSTALFYNPVTQANITNTLLAGATVTCTIMYMAL